MRSLLAALLFTLLAACTPRGDTIAYEIVSAGKSSPHASSSESCSKIGGSWADVSSVVLQPEGTVHSCIIPTSDGGTVCSSATDCQSMCVLAEDQDVEYGDRARGVCMATYFTQGCRQYVHKGRFALAICAP
jgi:hypothetical protein